MNNKSVSTATIGYMCFALSFWLLGVYLTRWTPSISLSAIWAIHMPLSILLLVMGILAFVNGRSLDTIVFFGGSALLWSTHSIVVLPVSGHDASSPGFDGWFFIAWTAFFAWVWVGALKSDFWRMQFLLSLWLTHFVLIFDNFFYEVHVIEIIGGYLCLVTGLLAAVVSAKGIISGRIAEDGRGASG